MRTAILLTAVLALSACAETESADPPAPPADPAAGQSGVPVPGGLTADERLIWNSLTPEAQARAAEFIANGGTLSQFVAV